MAVTTWFRNLPVWAKAGIALTGGLLIGSATYLVLQANGLGRTPSRDGRRRRRQEGGIDAESKDNTDKAGAAVNQKSSPDVISGTARRVLVLGLANAGKSSLLARLTKVERAAAVVTDKSSANAIKPTDGFSVICMQTASGTLNIWEIGGTDKNRAYWENFVRDTDLLVYVVDSTDDDLRLEVAVAEFRKLVADVRLDAVPVLLLANKQDIVKAKNQFDIEKLFGCKNGLVDGHRVRVLGTRAPPDRPSHPSVGEAERLIITMSVKK